MQLFAAFAFGMVLVGGLALIAALLRAESARVLAILSGAELKRARTPRVVRVSAPVRTRGQSPSRSPASLAAAA